MSTKFWQRIFSFVVLAGMLFTLARPGSNQAQASVKPSAVQQEDPRAKIEQQVIDELNANGQTDFFVIMKASADLSPASKLTTKDQKGNFVFNALRATAESTQKDLRAYLDKQGVKYTSYYIANTILVSGGTQTLLNNVASRTDVKSITANHKIQLEKPFIKDVGPDKPAAIESNLTFVKAPDVWAMGFTGQGTVLAGNDTGLQWDHPAIINHYRGWDGANADHNYNWWDATGGSPSVPYDGYGHGTHTTGTMVGDDGGANQIGMAPGAQTIHCRNMDSGGGGIDAWFLTCFEWDLAPWDLNGNNPRPDLAPDAVNNSWGYWGGNNDVFRSAVDALQAAGTLVEVSAGNEGPSCTTLRSPGDYQEVMTTGSVQHAGGVLPGTITGFSSRGPSLLDGNYFPDVMAPGENIRSSVPGSIYQGGWSGTSMAGPHVVGLVGLLWSVNPALRGLVDTTMQIIKDTAIPLTGQTGSNCGGDYTEGPNNDWGVGTIDSLAAAQLAMSIGGAGTLQGHVSDSVTGNPIQGAHIVATLSVTQTFQTNTNAAGDYSMVVFAGTYTVDATAYGYYPDQATGVVVPEDGTVTQNFVLVHAPSSALHVTIVDANTGWPLYAVTNVGGTPFDPFWNNPVTGQFTVDVPTGGTYVLGVDVWTPGYLHQDVSVGPVSGDTDVLILMQPNVAACNAPGYSFQAVDFLNQDFEANDGGFVASGSNSTWAWGAPTSGPGAAHSGSNAWATNLNGNYNDYEDSYITSPVIDLSSQAGHAVVVDWWQWLQVESGFDYGSMDVSSNGGASWATVYGPYTGDVDLSWAEHSVTLDSSYATSQFQIRYHLTTDVSVTYPGYYVDDVKVRTGQCVPGVGGLVVGNVYDTNEHNPLTGAMVSNDAGFSTETVETIDPAVGDAFYVLFSPNGAHTFTATMDGFGPDAKIVNVPLNGTTGQDFYLPAGHLIFDPLSLHVNLLMGDSTTVPLTITNNGDAAASFEIMEIDKGFIPVVNAAGTKNAPAGADTSKAPAGYVPTLTKSSFAPFSPASGTVAVFKDANPWGTTDVETFLAANGIPYEVHGSSEFATLDFSQFGMIIFSGDQPQGFYDTYAANASKFTDYVEGGGFLNFFSCDSGWNGGTLSAPLPGGMNWTGWIYENYNNIDDPAHPVVQGVANPFYGNYASHGHFSNLPAEAHVIASEQIGGNPTIVEYPMGAGWFIAFGQPLEISHAFGWDAGYIMQNTILWGYTYEPGGDVPWLSESPITGTIPGVYAPTGLRLSVDTTGGPTQNPGLTSSSPAVAVKTPAQAPVLPAAVLWDQPLSAVNQNAYVDQDFPDFPTYSSFLADDFINATDWQLSNIFIPGDGWSGFSSLLNASALTWAIYADCAGVPCGDPSGAGAPPVWSLSVPPTDPQVTLTAGTPGGYLSNTTLNLASPVLLPAGHYWLVFFPTLPFSGGGQYGRQAADTANGGIAQFVNPGGGFGYGSAWQNWNVLGATQTDIAFTLYGAPRTLHSQVVQVTFDAGVPEVTQPGDYLAQLKIKSDTPYPATTIPVTMTVAAPNTYGKLQGNVNGLGFCDLDSYPLADATVFIESVTTGMTWTLTTDEAGYYQIWLNSNVSPLNITVSAAGHVDQTVTGVVINPNHAITVEDFNLRWNQPCISETPPSLSVEILMGTVTTTQITLENTGAAAGNFEISEKDGGYTPVNRNGTVPAATPAQKTSNYAPNTTTTKGILTGNGGPVNNVLGSGDVLAQWATGLALPWGTGFSFDDGTVWFSNPAVAGGDDLDHEYEVDGTATGRTVNAALGGDWAGDLAFNPNTGMFWQVNVGGDNCLYEIDPNAGPTGNTICGPWSTSERGVAYDPATDTFYVGGWNDGTVWHIDSAGNEIESWFVALSIAGLAYNPEAGLLFIIENTATDTVSVFDVATGSVISSFTVAGFGNYVGAGLEIDCEGNLWAANQGSGDAYLIDSGVPANLCAQDVPWLSENPTAGVLPADTGVQTVDVTFDASVVPQPGTYYATLNIKTDNPVNSKIAVPVTLKVTPTPDYGILVGTVTDLGYCDTNPGPLEDATILIEDTNGVTYTVETDAEGHYSRWLKVDGNPYIVSVTADEHEYKLVSDVVIASMGTTTVDFDLRWLKPCVSADPAALNVEVPLGYDKTLPLDLSNHGAVGSDFKITEKEGTKLVPGGLRPVSEAKFSAPAAIGPLSVRSAEGKAAVANQPTVWNSAADMPMTDVRFAKAQCADAPDSFYIIGGVSEGSIIGTVARYDAETDSWTTLADFPSPQEGPTATCYEGFIYVVGGGGTTQFYVYDIANDTWMAGPALPRAVWGAAVGAYDGMLYMVGGDSDFYFGGTSNEVDIYDIASGTWVGIGSPMPTPRSTPGQVQAGQYLYVVGGWGDAAPGANSTATERYDMTSDTWEVGPSFDIALADGALAVTSQYLYAIGGDGNGNGPFDASADVYVLDHTEWPGGAWTDLGDPLPVAVTADNSGFCTQAIEGGEVWTNGGIDSGFVWHAFNTYRAAEACYAGSADVPWLAETPITGTIGHDSSFQVDVTFTAFPTLTVGSVYTAFLNIKTADPVTPKIVVPVAMTVVEPVYGVEVSADQTGAGTPGSVVTYTVTVTNTSNFATDSFTVTLGSHVYDTGLGAGELAEIVVGPLGIGESATFVVTVHIPDDAQAGDHDSVQITVTSIADPTKTATVTVTTNVFVTTRFVYLPLVWKAP